MLSGKVHDLVASPSPVAVHEEGGGPPKHSYPASLHSLEKFRGELLVRESSRLMIHGGAQ